MTDPQTGNPQERLYCSVCGEARGADDYTCRKGGKSIPRPSTPESEGEAALDFSEQDALRTAAEEMGIDLDTRQVAEVLLALEGEGWRLTRTPSSGEQRLLDDVYVCLECYLDGYRDGRNDGQREQRQANDHIARSADAWKWAEDELRRRAEAAEAKVTQLEALIEEAAQEFEKRANSMPSPDYREAAQYLRNKARSLGGS